MWRVVLATLGACASVDAPPEFGAPPLTVTTDPVHVIGPDFELDFAATGIHLPEHLYVENGLVDLLGTDDPCMGESQVGVAVTPALSVIAGTHGTSEIMVTQPGPAVAKIHVTFAADYTCPNAETLSGSIDFTIFPSGRIVREDAVQPSSDTLGLAGTCGCQHETDPQNFHNLFFTSFWAFAPTGATQVQANGSPAADDVYAACTMYAARSIGVAWSQVAVAGTHTRFHPNAAASHILDWASDQMSLATDQKLMTSAVQISNVPPVAASDCGAVLAKLADAPIKIGDTNLDMTDHDRIYRDPNPHPATFVITPTAAAIPSGFAISVDLAGADHATITRSPATTGRTAVVQRESGTRFLMFFPAGLAPGESITIAPAS